jgi:hypothetical protein
MAGPGHGGPAIVANVYLEGIVFIVGFVWNVRLLDTQALLGQPG